MDTDKEAKSKTMQVIADVAAVWFTILLIFAVSGFIFIGLFRLWGWMLG